MRDYENIYFAFWQDFVPLDVSFLFPIKAFDIGVVLVGIFLVLDNLSFMLIDRKDFKVTGSNLFVPIVCSILLLYR